MLIQMPAWQLVVVNVLAWLLIHLGVAWVGTRLPIALFRTDAWLYRIRPWERGGRLYERLFRVRRWKSLLPDGAALFAGGFRKGSLPGPRPEQLERFARETCRGEAVHWVVLVLAPLFLAWNPWWAELIILAYAAAANLPCIVVQRYNRARLLQILRSSGPRRPSRPG